MNIEKELSKAKKKLKKLERELDSLEFTIDVNDKVQEYNRIADKKIKEQRTNSDHAIDAINYNLKNPIYNFDKLIEETPKFKVGDFIANKILDEHFGFITKIDGSIYCFDGFSVEGNYIENHYYDFSAVDYKPTKEQILQHLIKVAEIKGLVKGVKFKSAFSGDEYEINEFSLSTFGNLVSNLGIVWKRSTNKWAEPIKVDFSILNDEDLFYMNNGSEYLFKGNAFDKDKSIECYSLTIDEKDLDLMDSGISFKKHLVKELRLQTKEEQKLFNSKFPKYKVVKVRSIGKFYIKDKKGENAVIVYDNEQLAEEICEFLNNKNV